MAEVRELIQSVLAKPQVAILATVTPEGQPWARYVMISADEAFTLRVATFVGSRKVAQIRKNAEVHLTCGVEALEKAERYLQIQGRAEVSTDEAERHACWNDGLKNYFSGPEDPNYVVLIVKPYRIEYMGMGSMQPVIWEA